MGHVLGLGAAAHGEALDALGENDRGLVAFLGALVGGIDFKAVVGAPAQVPDFFVGPVGHHGFQFRRVKEEFTHIGAVAGFNGLIVAVHHFHHAAAQVALVVLGEQFVPAAAPHHLDDVPAGALEFTFQLLNDFAVTAHRAVEALQVTADDEDQIVQMVHAGNGQLTPGFGFVHFAVAEEGPDLAVVLRQ